MRFIDITAATVGLMVLGPLMGLVAILIKINSKGPALFRQTRIGKNGKPFTCYKFRTMRIDTENRPSHEVEAAQITSVGRVLRRLKIDEIPQLMNVLRGEMSLVGPRPCLPSQEELLAARQKSGALEVLPGITGQAQIEGVDMSEPIRLAEIDGHYAKSRSLRQDLTILLKTVSHIASNKGTR